MGRTNPIAFLYALEPCGSLPADNATGGLHRRHVVLAHPQWDAQPLANDVAAALMVGMHVRKRVRRQLQVGDLLEDALLGLARGRGDQYVARHVHVDRVWWEALQHVEILGELLHLHFLRRLVGACPRIVVARAGWLVLWWLVPVGLEGYVRLDRGRWSRSVARLLPGETAHREVNTEHAPKRDHSKRGEVVAESLAGHHRGGETVDQRLQR